MQGLISHFSLAGQMFAALFGNVVEAHEHHKKLFVSFSFDMNLSSPPKEFLVDDVQGTFSKACSVSEPSSVRLFDIDQWELSQLYCYIDEPCRSQHDPIREVASYYIIDKSVTCKNEIFATLLSWEAVLSVFKFMICLK